jgi:curli biogenesis system outer membrane secretion channel CsgG
MRSLLKPLTLALVAAALAGCTSTGSTGSSAAPTSSPAASPAAATPVAGGSAATISRVSANTASQDEIAAALAAAGVPNADRWAREVVEYRPYDASDTTLQKLQDNLAKYNPDAATLAGILSALTP